MPAQAGESTLSTVQPGQRPVHDRFEKGSYVYIHHSPTSGTGRIEIANNAGTPEQDAFDGSLEFARISYTHKRPSQLCIAVVPSAPGAQWQLPFYAPGQDKKYMYPIHELDLYFWTVEDAKQVLEATRKVRSVNALNVQDAPPQQTQQQHVAGSNDPLSPVVQKLEQAAIGTSYQQSHRDSGSVNSSTVQAHSFASPPPTKSATGSQHEQATEAYKPVAAYNPAAPTAPEPIAHREKTPPPPDDGEGTGLHDQGGQQYHNQQGTYQPVYGQQQAHGNHYAPQSQSPFTQSFTPSSSGPTSFAGPPQARQSIHSATPPQRASSASSFPPPPPNQTTSATSQFPYTSTSPQPPVAQHAFQPTSLHSGPTSPDFRSPLQSPGFAPPPNTGLSAQQLQQQHQPQQPQQPQQHHYSQFSYVQPANQVQADAHSIHQQVYRPTEHEAAQGHGGGSSQGQASGLGSRADRLEKGVGRFLKKMDKKLGI